MSWGPGRIDVVAAGTDSALWHLSYDGAWSAWESLGGTLIASPGIASSAPGRLDVFVAGTDSALWHLAHEDGGGSWESLGGTLVSAPAAVSWEPDRIDVVAAGTDSALWHRWWEAEPEPALFVRREAWGLQAADPFDAVTLGYAHAVQTMQTRAPGDPTSWIYQAGVHGSVTAPPPGATWDECQHASWYFLSWHRMYLYFFERIARAAALAAGAPDDWALPYWNYDRAFPANTLPPAFRAPALPDGSPNPLCLTAPRRSAAIMAGGQLQPAATSAAAALARANFAAQPGLPSFGGGRSAPAHFGSATGQLEFTPHNNLHGAIGGPGGNDCGGGLMTDPRCAALDPIFWLHHANIDRLWNDWLALGGGRANPADDPWRTEPFVFHDETGAAVTMTGAEVVDTAAQLGYVYDDVPATSVMTMDFPAAPPPEPSGPPELAAATDGALELTGAAASVSLTLPERMRGTVAAAAEDAGRRMLISVEDIEGERNPGTTYAVYLDAPGATADATRARRHLGNVSFFGIEVMNDPDRPHGGAPGLRHVFDATDAVDALREQGAWEPGAVTVTFEPLEVLPPPGGELPVEAGVEAAEPVRVGRVALFVA